MHISIYCVGKLKKGFLSNGVKEYINRLNNYCNLSIYEVKEEKAPENLSEAEKDMVKKAEGKNLLKCIKEDMYVIALEITGKQLSSEKLAKKLEVLGIQGKSNIAFIIGGSLGLSEEILKRSDFILSFSQMTFPHQLMRIILMEQIYRSFKIIKNEPYHK